MRISYSAVFSFPQKSALMGDPLYVENRGEKGNCERASFYHSLLELFFSILPESKQKNDPLLPRVSVDLAPAKLLVKTV